MIRMVRRKTLRSAPSRSRDRARRSTNVLTALDRDLASSVLDRGVVERRFEKAHLLAENQNAFSIAFVGTSRKIRVVHVRLVRPLTACAIDHVVEAVLWNVKRLVRHRTHDELGHAGATVGIVTATDIITNGHHRDRQAMVFVDDDAKTIRELRL